VAPTILRRWSSTDKDDFGESSVVRSTERIGNDLAAVGGRHAILLLLHNTDDFPNKSFAVDDLIRKIVGATHVSRIHDGNSSSEVERPVSKTHPARTTVLAGAGGRLRDGVVVIHPSTGDDP
jgi:hypothetical protein